MRTKLEPAQLKLDELNSDIEIINNILEQLNVKRDDIIKSNNTKSV